MGSNRSQCLAVLAQTVVVLPFFLRRMQAGGGDPKSGAMPCVECGAYIGRPYWWRPACNMTVKQFTQETIKRLVWWRGSWWVFYCNQCAAVVDQRERVGNTFPPVDAAQDRRELGTVFTAIAGPGR